ncbi:MAG: ferric reductase-like transmembrane domain-containing protein [Pseudomonadota bacterium]
MGRLRAIGVWAALIGAMVVPLIVALQSPLLAWRDTIYIGAGFAGIIAMGGLLIQPLFIGGRLPGTTPFTGRRFHQIVGLCLVIAIVLHVGGLLITSPPDVIDVLLFRSPTPFAIWGVLAMWAMFATAILAALRRPLKFRPKVWRLAHTGLAGIIVIGTVLHAFLIEGTMGAWSKTALAACVVAAAGKVIWDRKAWRRVQADQRQA